MQTSLRRPILSVRSKLNAYLKISKKAKVPITPPKKTSHSSENALHELRPVKVAHLIVEEASLFYRFGNFKPMY